MKRGVYSGMEGWIIEGRTRTYTFVEKEGNILGGSGRFWEGRTNELVEKRGIFWKGEVYSC